jgi:uncharacterized protein (UPF0335 family)
MEKGHKHPNFGRLRAFENRMLRRILESKRGGDKRMEETAIFTVYRILLGWSNKGS